MSDKVIESLRQKMQGVSFFSGAKETSGYASSSEEVKKQLRDKLEKESGNRSEYERKKEIHALQEQIAELKTLIQENAEYNIKAEQYKAELNEVINKLKEVEK